MNEKEKLAMEINEKIEFLKEEIAKKEIILEKLKKELNDLEN